MPGFGANTDTLAFAETGIHLISVAPSKQGSAAQCPDSNGNVVEETVFDTGTGYVHRYEVDQGKTALIYDTTAAKDFRLGKVIGGKVITGINAIRSNTEKLAIELTSENTSQTDTQVEKFTPSYPANFLAGGKGALAAGIVISAGKVISSSINSNVQVSKGLDSNGDQVTKEVYAGRMEASNELMSNDTDPVAVADTANGWALSPGGSGPGETNTGYPTRTSEAFQNLAQDT
jgi:hypothetical protein